MQDRLDHGGLVAGGMRDRRRGAPIGGQPRGQLRRGERGICGPRLDHVARHVRPRRGVERLHQHHATGPLDRLGTGAPVEPRARQDDTDRVLAALGCQRTEEVVDRERYAVGRDRHEVQPVTAQLEVVARRDHVHAPGGELHPIGSIEYLQGRRPAEQARQQALVVGGEVLDDDERQLRRVGRQRGEEGLERRQPAGRRADADDTCGRAAHDGSGVVGQPVAGVGRPMVTSDQHGPRRGVAEPRWGAG